MDMTLKFLGEECNSSMTFSGDRNEIEVRLEINGGLEDRFCFSFGELCTIVGFLDKMKDAE